MTRTLLLGFALALAAQVTPLGGSAAAAPTVAARPPKSFDKKNAKDHLLKHQNYPATKAELVASCKNLIDFSAEDKKWFINALPEGTYQSAADVIKALSLD